MECLEIKDITAIGQVCSVMVKVLWKLSCCKQPKKLADYYSFRVLGTDGTGLIVIVFKGDLAKKLDGDICSGNFYMMTQLSITMMSNEADAKYNLFTLTGTSRTVVIPASGNHFNGLQMPVSDLQYSSLAEVKSYNGEAARFFLVKATIVGARETNSMYKSCLKDMCLKQVVLIDDDFYHCPKCGADESDFIWKLKLELTIGDRNDWIAAIVFQNPGIKLFKRSPYSLSEVYGGEWDEGACYTKHLEDVIMNTVVMTIKADKTQNYIISAIHEIIADSQFSPTPNDGASIPDDSDNLFINV